MTHHFALGVPDQDVLGDWREYLLSNGVQANESLDEEVFPSIALQDPDGLVIEIVSQTPAVAGDEPVAELGRNLRLPSSLESRRSEIEADLPPLSVPEPAGS